MCFAHEVFNSKTVFFFFFLICGGGMGWSTEKYVEKRGRGRGGPGTQEGAPGPGPRAQVMPWVTFYSAAYAGTLKNIIKH